MSRDTRLSLAMIRNNLYNGRFDEPDRLTLDIVTATIRDSQSPFRKLMLHAIENAKTDIAAHRLMEAGYELNAIHNLPLGTEDFRVWDKEWFFTAEVPSYLERAGTTERGKVFLELVGEGKLQYDAVAL